MKLSGSSFSPEKGEEDWGPVFNGFTCGRVGISHFLCLGLEGHSIVISLSTRESITLMCSVSEPERQHFMHNILYWWKCQMRFDVVANPGLCVLRWSAAVPVLDVLWGSGGWSVLAGCWCLCRLWYHLAQSPVGPLVCTGSHWAPGAWTGCFLHCQGFCSRAGVWSSASLLQQPPVQLWDGHSHRQGRDPLSSETPLTH